MDEMLVGVNIEAMNKKQYWLGLLLVGKEMKDVMFVQEV